MNSGLTTLVQLAGLLARHVDASAGLAILGVTLYRVPRRWWMERSPQFRSYDEFFAFYIQQHTNRNNRRLHAAGTLLGLVTVVVALGTGHPWLALLWVPIGYGFAWAGHFLLEKNQPATFGHPWWSLISDFRMLGLMLTGKLDKWLVR